MKRLRHPIRSIREPFGTAGLIVACIALIAALGGTAIAAKGALTGKQKKEVEKIAKKYAGKNGKNGVTGATGPQGSTGQGGAKGDNGKDGTNGTNGVSGKSVTVGTASAGECAEGGITVEVEGSSATKKKVCNGEEGAPGPEGPEGALGTAGTTLPSKASETGSFAITNVKGEGAVFGVYEMAPISFVVPLAAPLDATHVKLVTTSVPAECENSAHPGSASGENPEASPGYLCVYATGPHENLTFPPGQEIVDPHSLVAGTGVSGAALLAEITAPKAFAVGTWAVTAP